MKEILLDAFFDVLRLIPFLFISFILMESIEHKFINKIKISKINKFGPFLGATLGIIPQCGFSAVASNLYAVRIITLGTLFSIYLSTSDEMIPILIANHTDIKEILLIIFIKFAIGMLFGIFIDLIIRKKNIVNNEINNICKEEDCHCEDGIIKSSIIHTFKIVIFIFLINIILNSIIDRELIANFAKNNMIFSPILTSLIGLIPNCASSIIITELYLEGVITFGSCISGLLCGSGVGILILFKQNKNLKENIFIMLTLIIFSSICGIIFNFI